MKNNLVESVKFCFTDAVIDQLGTVLSEDPTAIKKGLAQTVPLVLDSVLRQAEQEGNPAALLLLARETAAASGQLQRVDVADAAWYQQGGAILVELLGSTYGATVSRLAYEADLRPAAAEMLLQVTAAAVLGVLGKFAAEKGLTPSEFVQWLPLQKGEVGATVLPALREANGPAVPVATSRPPAMTPPRLVSTPSRRIPQLPSENAIAAAARPASVAPEPRVGGGNRGWQWGLLLLVAVSLGYFFGHDRLATGTAADTKEPAAAVATAATAAAPSAAQPTGRYDQNRDTYIYDTGQPIILTLADGTTQKVGANSTENRLYTFLATPSVQVDSVNRTKGWINFDRVYFDPAKATLTPESAQQLHNVASILKTFPKAIVKIGGYTDSSGVAIHNFQLSEERAKAAMFTLISLGIPADNLQYKGYGPKHFLTSNNTPAGRALNRRISVRVIQK